MSLLHLEEWLSVWGWYAMPSKGFKSITVSDDVYDYAMNLFIDPNTEKIRMKWTKMGITSFAGFVAWKLGEK